MRNYLTNKDYWQDDLFDHLFSDSMFMENNNKHLMKTNIKETDKAYELEVEMPGYNKDNIKMSLDNGYLTIEAIVENKENKDEKKHYIRRERYYGSMSRSYYVGENIQEKDIHASFENGVLNIEIAKQEPVKEEKKYIQIA